MNSLPKHVAAILSACILLCTASCSAEKIRQPAVAGQFYPKDPAQLTGMIRQYIGAAEKITLPGKPLAFIVPHAGYVYSGPAAGYVYTHIRKGSYPTVLILGLAHRYPVRGAALYTEGSFKTPLGLVPVNEELCGQLMEQSSLIQDIPEAHTGEHSVEVQIPFLQHILGDFDIVPMIMGNPDLSVCREIGTAIAKIVKGKNILLLASTDMSHFPNYKDANRVDRTAIRALETGDPEKLHAAIGRLMAEQVPNLSCVFCGEGATYTMMYAAAALGADRVTALKYNNSGDTAGTKDRVVGYLSAAFTSSQKEGSRMTPAPDKPADQKPFSIKPENQKTLLKIARNSIAAYLTKRSLQKVDARGDAELAADAAVFVTLNKHGNLRGCIGTTEARDPLIDAVNQLAVSSAFQDHRFPPVSERELDDLHIEISVLSPIRKISSHTEITPDVHGVIVKKAGRSGLFLPQVWEHFPGDKEAFMGELCAQKAGLSRNAWKSDPKVELYTFTVFSFEEPKK